MKKEVHILSTGSSACVRYMGNTTKNVVEYAHSKLKKYLTSSMGCLCMNCSFVHNMLDMLESQHTQIHMLFYMSVIMLKTGSWESCRGLS